MAWTEWDPKWDPELEGESAGAWEEESAGEWEGELEGESAAARNSRWWPYPSSGNRRRNFRSSTPPLLL